MKNTILIMSLLLATTSFAQPQKRSLKPNIVGGVEASMGEFPFIVSLQGSGGHFCGGSLIKKNWVLTAAHCTSENIQRVVIGLHDRTDMKNAEIIKPLKVIAHPQYNEQTTDFDFALIQLEKDSSYEPVALNNIEIQIPDSPVDQILATTAGWGTTSEGSFSLPRMLQKVEVPLVTAKECNAAYPGSITDRMICAGLAEGGKDSCQGDSGGPLVAEDSNHQKHLIGVVSWGYGCAQPKQYGVYSKVSAGYSWIQQTAQ